MVVVALLKLLMILVSFCSATDSINSEIGGLVITQQQFNSVFSSVSVDVQTENFMALSEALNIMNVSFSSTTQIAAFLGTVAFNTENLQRHHARCVDSNSCDLTAYDTICNPDPEKCGCDTGVHYYPRSAMMITYKCGYENVDSILRQVSSLADMPSLVRHPNLLNSHLNYSYLASLAAWTEIDSNQDSCMSLSEWSLDEFPLCMKKMNPWECTIDGANDLQQHINSIVNASTALGVNLSQDQIESLASCQTTSSSPTPTPSTATTSPTATSVAPTSSPDNTTVSPTSPVPSSSSSVGPTDSPNDVECGSNLPVVNGSWPAPGSYSTACGLISPSIFQLLANTSNVTMNSSQISNEFQSLATACDLSGIRRLDIRQASFVLGLLSNNLTNSMISMESDSTSIDDLSILRRVHYQSLTEYMSSLGMLYNAIDNPSLMISNRVISYLSMIMIMQQKTQCLQLTSAGDFGSCLSQIGENQPCRMNAILSAVQQASAALGKANDLLLLQSIRSCNCSSVDDEEDLTSGVNQRTPTTMIVLILFGILSSLVL